MRFYARGNAFVKMEPDTYPAICFRKDRWNDFGYYTYYYVDYYPEKGAVIELGTIRILERQETHTFLPGSMGGAGFEVLTEEYCSAGSKSYYRGLKAISDEVFQDVLTRMRDCLYDSTIHEAFKAEEGFRKSINRDGIFDDTKKWFDYFIDGRTYEPEDFRFTFHTPVNANGTGRIEVTMDFRPVRDQKDWLVREIPNRINLLVGKNGCGKTCALSRLANYFARIEGISGQSIEGCSMMFEKVLVISYSLFDAFTKPFELYEQHHESGADGQKETGDPDARRLNNYVYCGLIGRNGIMSIDDMKDHVQKARVLIRKKNREEFWAKQAERLLAESPGGDMLSLQDLQPEDYEKLELSSGQYFLFSIISELIANIDENSVVLIDEPEMHLHPNAVSNLLKIIYEILDEYDSYAVMATHSPVILQEVPRRYIAHMVREDNSTYTASVPIETFGSELSSIVDTVFDVDMVHSNYKTVMEKLTQSRCCQAEDPYEEINRYFDGGLSFQARMFLRSLIEEGKGE